MNKKDAKAIAGLMAELGELQGKIDKIRDQLESFADAEREAFDNLSDDLQQSETGQRMEICADGLEEAVGVLDMIDLPLDAVAVVEASMEG